MTKKTDDNETVEPGTEVATTTPAGVPATFDYGTDAGAGFEDTNPADLSVPFLGILQSNSPQIDGDDIIDDAKPGMLFNTVTRELTAGDTGLIFLPCHKETAYVEWVKRINGGGFVGLHDPNGQEVKDAIDRNDGNRFGKLAIGDNELLETHYVYGLMLDEMGLETMGFSVISFTSTKIKPFRDWVTAMYTLKGKPPMFANRARIRTVKQKNDHGTFYNFRIDPFSTTWAASLINPSVNAALLTEARDFSEMVVTGMARAAFDTERSTTGTSDGAADGGADPDKAPF